MKNNICYKCGKALSKELLTKEHIPPKALVTIKNREKLIRVNSCIDCNVGRAKDDEYFRTWITTSAAGFNAEAKQIYESKVKRSLRYNPKIKMGLRNMIEHLSVFTESGIYIGDQSVLRCEEKRVIPVLDSIGKGIIYHHFNNNRKNLPFNIKPDIIEDPPLNDDFMKYCVNNTIFKDQIPDVFNYRFVQLPIEGGLFYPLFISFYNIKLFYLGYIMEKK